MIDVILLLMLVYQYLMMNISILLVVSTQEEGINGAINSVQRFKIVVVLSDYS